MSPAQADKNPSLVTWKQRNINQKTKLNVGDKVRISIYKSIFTNGYLPNWSTAIFTIVQKNQTSPPIFIFKDYRDKPMAGSFYSQEIHKTAYSNDYL